MSIFEAFSAGFSSFGGFRARLALFLGASTAASGQALFQNGNPAVDPAKIRSVTQLQRATFQQQAGPLSAIATQVDPRERGSGDRRNQDGDVAFDREKRKPLPPGGTVRD